jgi:hypothetical protein
VHTPRIRYASRAPGIYYIIYHIHRRSQPSGFFVRAVARGTGRVGPTCGLLRLNCRPRVDDPRRGISSRFLLSGNAPMAKASGPLSGGRGFSARCSAEISSRAALCSLSLLPSGTGLDSDSRCLTSVLTPDDSQDGVSAVLETALSGRNVASCCVPDTLLCLAACGR